MATSNVTPATTQDELTIEEFFWGRIYSGSRAAFLASGLVTEEDPFPGDPGENKYSISYRARFKKTGRPMPKAERIERASGNRFIATVPFTEREKAEYEVKEKLRLAKEEEAKLPRSVEQFKARTLENARLLGALFTLVTTLM